MPQKMRGRHLEERADGYGDHLDGVRPLQFHRCWVLHLWQKATPMRTTVHGPRVMCVSLFYVQWLCHNGRRHLVDCGALAHTTLGCPRPDSLCEVWRGAWPWPRVALV